MEGKREPRLVVWVKEFTKVDKFVLPYFKLGGMFNCSANGGACRIHRHVCCGADCHPQGRGLTYGRWGQVCVASTNTDNAILPVICCRSLKITVSHNGSHAHRGTGCRRGQIRVASTHMGHASACSHCISQSWQTCVASTNTGFASAHSRTRHWRGQTCVASTNTSFTAFHIIYRVHTANQRSRWGWRGVATTNIGWSWVQHWSNGLRISSAAWAWHRVLHWIITCRVAYGCQWCRAYIISSCRGIRQIPLCN